MDDNSQTNGQHGLLQPAHRLEELPEEILYIIRMKETPRFLDTLAQVALTPPLTLKLFTLFEPVFADTCSRWISKDIRGEYDGLILGAFARILPLAPHLSTYLEKYFRISTSSPSEPLLQLPVPQHGGQEALSLQRLLLSMFRLLKFNKGIYAQTISGSNIQDLLQHADRAIRYLAVRIFCILLSASDSKLEAMIQHHVGKGEAIMGDYDGRQVDYGFLSLFEEKRLTDAHALRSQNEGSAIADLYSLNLETVSGLVVRYSSTLLPRPHGPPIRPSSFVATSTTAKNMEAFARSLLSSSPILLHGLAGSGKTLLVNDFARELGVDSNMVRLHLNEQTDAKMLIGMYTSGPTPGTFKWQAGVLTTAVKEGRWVFIEDLDRAPNEVISVILPLIERGELLIPSRGETIRAGPGFKLLASIRTSLNVAGQENPPATYMLGARLWQRVPVQMPSHEEFREIIQGLHPVLNKFLPVIIRVYDRLFTLSHTSSFVSSNRASLGRPVSPRDLLKWCRRLESVLFATGSKSGLEAITEATEYEMFLEATDCFAGSLQTEHSRRAVISCIAEEMRIDPQRVEHFLSSHNPRYDDAEAQLSIGRVRLSKRKNGRVTKSVKKSRPFANTNHAKCLLEQVGVAVNMAEPVLLVGETGIGKTTVIQQLADSLGYKLTAVNLSQQSEVGDLLGGFKPVNVKSLAIPLKEEFDDLFAATGISTTKNEKYLSKIRECVAKSHWSRVSKLLREAPKMFDQIIGQLAKKEAHDGHQFTEQPAKRRKTESKMQILLKLKPRWELFSQNLDQFDVHLSGGSKGFAFTFVEGNIVKAARNGDWVLLDEINLASPDTLESIADLLHSDSGSTPSLLLSETGKIERVLAHPTFRIFGAMNPATDVGKRDLPMSLRSRFTEIYVESPDKNLDNLLAVIKAYLKGTSSNDDRAVHDVARLYMNTKRLADEKRLVDGANQVPHFSLRTLTRVLSYVTDIAPLYGLRRALYEGFAMGFLTLLDRDSEKMLNPLINHHLLDGHGNPQALLSQLPKHPEDGAEYVRFVNRNRDRQYWMKQGEAVSENQSHYIITPFVERNMLNLVRATSTRRFPVLVQGPTSAGKTSMIEYLAKFSGNKFVRINNHEHTDLQEYLGTYVSGSDGQLHFQEGLLVQALRQGHWIVLDELNLAPTDVLEALNRLLDDNRELLIPETQETVRPHENFMLFATQNPPGLYGGRKTLSRAFRNRFLELHFDDIPEDELHTILEKRSEKVAPSDCKRIVTVYKELSRLRQSNRLFEQKDSFATLRDLFRWALRDADNREQLAANGYMLLAERVRNPDERLAVKNIIEQVMKVKIDPLVMYDAKLSPEMKMYEMTSNKHGVVWTQAMRRLYVLVSHALRNNEPVLLVGETGCGKTTVCQMLADAFGKELHIVNAHQNTETGDLIGAQRPIRNRAAILELMRESFIRAFKFLGQQLSKIEDLDTLLAAYQSLPALEAARIPEAIREAVESTLIKSKALFEWSDGSLVRAMRDGQLFLLDEISLADDSVLERLNSVLETQRTILLAEKGVEDSFVQATDGFQFLATMNPGGDYGKRELSPALRNRFTEIWVPSLSEHEDVFQIIEAKLPSNLRSLAKPMVFFAEWFGETYRASSSTTISVRDVLAWVKFIRKSSTANPYFALLHGAAMVYIDTLGANPAALLAISPESLVEERAKCLSKISELVQHDVSTIYYKPMELLDGEQHFTIGDFSIAKQPGSDADPGFAFEAPTTKINAMRIIRALQVQKPILIEGNPGVGKTTLIAALARACNWPLTRINLSEQTDLMDLFGSDVPVEGAEAGHFAWRDAPFLQAMQKGEWVLLDEMNLASQSVLEGLNACLDHRGEVYISELDQTFQRHPKFCVFAAQNPHHQGGSRKGLPASFVNRFTVVYADVFRNLDLQLICQHTFPAIPDEMVATIIDFVSQLEQEIVHKRIFGSQGGPWEFNLRDILRWLQLLSSSAPFLSDRTPADFLDLIFRLRFRTPRDRREINRIFLNVFGSNVPFRHFFHNLSSSAYQVCLAYMQRDALVQRLPFPDIDPIHRLPEIESLMICIQQNVPCILVGPSGSGKSTMLQHVAAASGKSLVVFPLNADIDTMDLVGGFEQVDPHRSASAFLEELEEFVSSRVLSSLPLEVPSDAISILELLRNDVRTSSPFFFDLSRQLRALESKTSMADFGKLADTCQRLAETSMSLENARFEWVDGVLVKALEQGKWLVLDNANLCSASVLDRLNSLLEPNGFLSINEHCNPDGEPKIVKPHPEFRIFLTMDARFGELSRAMRNRAIEIFLDPLPVEMSSLKTAAMIPKSEASMQRFSQLRQILESPSPNLEGRNLLGSVALDNLAWSDFPMLLRFAQTFQTSYPLTAQLSSISQRYHDIYLGKDHHNYRAVTEDMLDALAGQDGISQHDNGFREAQIIHPLQNSPFIPLLQHTSSNSAQVFWLGALFELNLESKAALEAQRAEKVGLNNLKPSKMNRLQRSLVSGRVSAVAKDSTVRASNFLAWTLDIFNKYLEQHVQVREHWKVEKKLLRSLLQYWWDTYYLVISPTFEEATFQAHLAIGYQTIAQFPDKDHYPIVVAFENSLRREFSAAFKLTTGLSMEVLWKEFRPIVISKAQIMDTVQELERLAVRFDALRWRASISVSELGAITTSMVKAYHLVLTSDVEGPELTGTISKELDALESSFGSNDEGIKPFLTDQFEALRQFKALEDMRCYGSCQRTSDVDIIFLANYPTASEMRLEGSTQTSRPLQSIDYLLGPSDGLQPTMHNFSNSLLHRMNAIGDVDLNSLKMLEIELPILGQKITRSSATLSRNQVLDLNQILAHLMVAVVSAHNQHSGREHTQLLSTNQTVGEQDAAVTDARFPSHLQEVLALSFDPASSAITTVKSQPKKSMQYSARAWVNFAVGCLTLFVPDRAFDPDKRQRLERERHLQQKEILNNKLSALKQFEILFSRQESNVRIQLLQEELFELGEPVEVLQEIYRPEVSELDQLQGEFNNLLKTIVQSNPDAKLATYFDNGGDSGLQEIKLLQKNVIQVVRRLSDQFRAYNDLTAPVITMLRCLQIGLHMATFSSESSSAMSKDSLSLSKITPFLGGRPAVIDEDVIVNQPMEYLQLVATTAAIEGVVSFRPDLRQSLLHTFHTCYEQWTKRLESDRLEAESQKGLYRFKGSAEDEEEEDQEQFNELFPSWDDESSEAVKGILTSNSARDTSVKLANVHASIFLGDTAPLASIHSLIRRMSNRIGHLHDNGSLPKEQNMTSALLPGALLTLNDHIESLSPTSTVSESYNFYTSANLPEVRKLVALIHQIQNRFRELQAVDEIGHMQPLEDVIVSCRELLQFCHPEPLAKFITKLEKIHGFMHEWQFGGWASRANSALTLYDNITQTIVNWRRLELSTWAKLFDMEIKTCDEDAKSWWFVAYQVIVAAPLAISGSESELRSYAQKLLQDLEAYFSTAIVGQFVQRLQLLRQLQQHLQLLELDVPSMSVIYAALANFIALYRRYEKPVEESLKKGRASLEKAMRDVLLLASWKDTNIVALRDSAKRSHHKLFKIVRKFRALLGQPMEGVLKQGLPDETILDRDTIYQLPLHLPMVDQSALQLCADVVPKWFQKSKRFVNVSKTVSMMADAAEIPDSAVRGSSYLDSFIANIAATAAELQKATPSILNDGNKDVVKHLKSRKRKLFADTLKELRQMGVKYNLGVNSLAKQESLSAVLANVQYLTESKMLDDDGLQYYFHKSIDLVSKAREAARQHSEDLSSAEVTRSVGFLEGLLQTLLAQRNGLANSVNGMFKLEQNIKMAKGLWAPNTSDIRLKSYASNHANLLRWLPNILAVGLDLVKVHSKLGKMDTQKVESSISAAITTFNDLSHQWEALEALPDNIVSSHRQELEKKISDSSATLSVELREMNDIDPGLSYILTQILPWTEIQSSIIIDNALRTTLTDLDMRLSTVCDSVLVTIENHKASIVGLPTSTEDSGWLAKNDTALSNLVKELHCTNITRHLDETFAILRGLNLADDQTSKAAGAIFAVALPILEQYFNTLQQSIIRCAQLHRATCKTSYILSKTFIQIATQGFCTPSENSDDKTGQTEKLEGGTGLGDGEGAEDISKDIQEDEDLDDLAQEPNQGEKGEMEDEQDAVDMADGDIEGEIGEGEEKDDEEGSNSGDGEDEIDEEAGDVDELDAGAVDEKMWDGDGEQAEKDQEGDDSKGKASKDEQVAAQENNKESLESDEGEAEDEDAVGVEHGEEVTQQDDVEKHDPHAQEGEALDLPEDMELDGGEDEKSVDDGDDEMNDLSDIEEDAKEGDELANDGEDEPEDENIDTQEDQEMGDDMNVVDLDEENEEGGEATEEAGENAEPDADQEKPDEEGLLQDRSDEANADADNAVPSDVQGAGEDQDENLAEEQTESSSKAQREDGSKGAESSEQTEAAAEDGEKSRQSKGDAPQSSRDETKDTSEARPFKKLGDALESWHRQHTQIKEPAEPKDQSENLDVDMVANSSEFQHLQDESAEADTQALGTATEEQAHALDESMAVDAESEEVPETFQPDEIEQDNAHDDVVDLEDPSKPQQQDPSDAYEGREGATINQTKEDRDTDLDDSRSQAHIELEEDVEEVDNQLDRTHLDASDTFELLSAADARQQWAHYESLTRNLSLSLTEQLRLILAPTLATKMRGDFRTGKRLNIKRIIPYIASQYKRDKIWMRRSVPSKRSYQIMLAVDDSKSMGESGSGSLAFETLVMVSKSLGMLEVGQICVVGFGENVKVAHEFETPFSSDAGPKIFQNFAFEQSRTDVAKLVRESIELFRAARAKASSSPADLWQMQLIISDGVCDSSEHEPIRRLLREALEERIMMVFVIVDDVRNKKAGESVMDLKEAKFVKDESTGVSKVKVERYLDTFPFQYYLIVSDVKELPGVLATLLRQWFAEVVDSSN